MSILNAFGEAIALIFSGDTQLWGIIGLSLTCSLIALLFIAPLALLVAYGLATLRFWGRRWIIVTLQGLLSIPTVVIGLLLYIVLSRSGPLGFWGILYTPKAIIIGQMILAFPILVIFALSAIQKSDNTLRDVLRSVGASRLRVFITECYEVRFALLSAWITGFGRVISEIGCALMVGGNIASYTRTIPTAIALDTGKGEFSQGIALGMVLILITILMSILLSYFQGDGQNS